MKKSRHILLGTSLGLLTQGALSQPASRPAAGPVEEILVTEEARQSYRVEDNSLSKLTESIRDTPQSIATLSRELLEDRGDTSLNDALRNVPGITLGAGEFSWQGNNPTIRGFNARDDLYLDGLRDFGSYPRDPFNLETVEVLLGPSSILFGRGSTGGAINQVTKQPHLSHSTDLAVNVGTADTVRATVDMSRPVPLLGEGAAWRLNLLAHDGGVADRDGAESQRFGFAPSLTLGLGSTTEVTLSYMKQTADDRPDYGLPWLNGRPAAVPRDRYYGFDSDYLKTDADIVSTQVLHSVSDTIRLNAQVRYAQYERENRITEPLITPAPPLGTPLEQIAVCLRPGAHHEGSGALVGAQQIGCAPETAHALPGGEDGERDVHDRRLALPREQRLHPRGCGASQLERVLARLHAALEQNLLRLERVRRVRRVHEQRLAPHLRCRGDLGHDEELVHAAVAPEDDDDVLAGRLDHGHRVVHRAVRDLKRTLGEAGALGVGVGREREFDRQAVLLENAPTEADEERQVLGTEEGVHAKRRECLRPHRASDGAQTRQGEQQQPGVGQETGVPKS